jgi:hypothetical protein
MATKAAEVVRNTSIAHPIATWPNAPKP